MLLDDKRNIPENHSPFLAYVPILYPLKTPEIIKGLLVFSGGIKREHWPVMGFKYFTT